MTHNVPMLAIIGPYPPPYGGVSVHIQRIAKILKSHNLSYIVYDQYGTEDKSNHVLPTEKKISWWFSFLLQKSSKIVHFHQFSFLVFIYAFFYSFLHDAKIYITIHNEDILNHSFWKRWFAVFLLKYTRNCTVIVVSKKLHSLLSKTRVIRIYHIPAYVPPVVTSPKFLDGQKNSNKKAFFFNAWRLNDSESTIYGFDLLLKLANEYNNANFYCFVSDPKSADFVNRKSKSLNLSNIKTIVGESLVDYLHEADLFLRLNREDAYGVSIKESLDLGVPVIASDACTRPLGAVLFKNGSYESLLKQVRYFESIDFRFSQDKEDKSIFHIKLLELYARDLEIAIGNNI